MKIYTGKRVKWGCMVEVDGKPLPLRLDLMNHSPDGFEWGYGGSGPAQLALALLADCLDNDEKALEIYEHFKLHVISNLPREWTLDEKRIREVVLELDKEMNNLIRLINVPVPPMLEQALGYEGQHRYVAFWWEPAGDELAWEDGRSGKVGANWHAWLTFTRHPRVSPYLETYELGNSDEPAQHWLLLDRQARTLYVGTTPDVAHFLAQHTPLAPAIPPGEDAVSLQDALNMGIDALFASMREIPPPSQAEIRRHMEEQARLETELKAWLDTVVN